METTVDATLAALSTWMPSQRWYASKGSIPQLRLVADWETAVEGAKARLLLVADEGSGAPVLYQVPVVERAESGATGLIGLLPDGTALVDGVIDPAFTRWLYETVTRGGRVDGDGGGVEGFAAAHGPQTAATATSTVFAAEQSNTSVIFRPNGDGVAIICKLFRQVHPGLNPDIELQTALAEAGSTSVPAAVGSLEGTWRDPAGSGDVVTGSLAFAQEFLPDVEDAWRVALGAAESGQDFTAQADALGRAVADVHLSLGRVFDTVDVSDADKARVAAVWDHRLETAIAHVPALADVAPAIRATYTAALSVPWPALQRIHGDLHLGQVLEVGGRGWVVLDFEGEPLRPMVERRAADMAARDVAGMLRSFDYVAGTVERSRPEDSAARDWSTAAKTAFLSGYADAGGAEGEDALLRAFELDKAVYETIYEVRNRPDWLSIPLDAIARLTAS
ncbi:aminoglycoside phosphotransferase [Microbacterium sp. P05]|uniref:maltokinase N-terminal cap-like domain-containing protein n=1 Tax=Microbacterium sp. P05 TaxID=3366948 RepID=UPI003746B541